MGPGGSQQDAAFDLRASVPAGNYHVECDSIILGTVDVTFSLIWRRGSNDTELATWTKHWDPLVGDLNQAQSYDVDMPAMAIDFQNGDQLVFRYAGSGSASPDSFVPNGDPASSGGRTPAITLP